MKEQHLNYYLPEFIDGTLSEIRENEVKIHLKNCESCRVALEELEQLEKIFKKDTLKKPSSNLKNEFNKFLEAEKKAETKSRNFGSNGKWQQSLLKIAAGIILVLGGYFLGRLSEKPSVSQVSKTSVDTNDSKENTMLALMKNTSASKRIKGVYFIDQFENPDKEIVKALIERMESDENVNVRLAAIEALDPFIQTETVKNAFINKLETEEEPVAQIAIINSLVKIQEQKALESMQRLLNKEGTAEVVKKQLQHILPKRV